MRITASEDDYEAKNDFFDPFWVLFSDDDTEGTSDVKERKTTRKSQPQIENTGSVFNYFARDESSPGEAEGREPTQYKKNQKQRRDKKQHYWRRNQPKKEKETEAPRLGFGRRGNTKRNLHTSASNSVESNAERRDLPLENTTSRTNSHYNTARTDGRARIEESNAVFKPASFPDFMEAISTPWDGWGEQTSTSDSSGSVETSLSDASSGSASASVASRSLRTHEKQEVQQILMQFNPISDTPRRNREVTTFEQSKPTSIKTVKTEMNSLPSRTNLDLDQSTISTYEKFDNGDGSTPNNEQHNMREEGRESSSCLNLQKVCGTGKTMIPFRRKQKDELCRQDLATIFPKLRMVADDKVTGRKSSAIVPNSKNFKGNVPAHLQVSPDAFLSARGPQSLYEYEYDGAEHIDVAYNHFGPHPLSLLVIRHHSTPPRPKYKEAIIQVEASTISVTDCSMRSGEWMGKDTPPLPITPGVDMVGKVFRIDKQVSSMNRISVGDRVISLTRCGGNSRFLSIDPEQLVKISEDVDPAEAVCLAETYLSAFQVLHFGQSQGTRYRNNALKSKSILILGTVATTLGHAIVEIATAAGVEKILATATPKHFPHLRSLGIIPVSVDPALWYDQLNGEIDLVLVTNANEEVVAEHFKVLNERGHLIVVGQRLGSGLPIRDWESKEPITAKSLVCLRNKTKASMIDRTHDYNPFQQWEQDLDRSKKDLSHLVRLLEKGDIKPNVLDRIPLNKVAKAQEMVESQRHPSGFLVCEPWLRNKKRAVKL